MTRALNKNKKPETNNKNRARNYFLGSFGSPCGFWRLGTPHNIPFTRLRSFLHHPPTKC